MSPKLRKRLLIQGATGSIGTGTLEVVRAHPDRFQVTGLAARSNVEALQTAAREFRPCTIALEDSTRADLLHDLSVGDEHPRIYAGAGASLAQAVEGEYDRLVNAQLGSAGLEPTLAALERGISVALANKETLVAAGPLVMKTAAEHGASVIPIDSEHSAIFQCLIGESRDAVRKIWLTTSGGPFWGRRRADLESVTVAEALAHPTWKMGPKITVDSATLFNKGLEVIETSRLFGVGADQIGVVAHRQSVIHSMVEFKDGSIKAQLSRPDMKLPILYALTYPDRHPSDLVRTDVERFPALTFEPVSPGVFPCLDLAFEALQQAGTAPAGLSAADEIAVEAFLNRQIRFTDIAEIIGHVLRNWPVELLSDLPTVRLADARARDMADYLVRRRRTLAEAARCC